MKTAAQRRRQSIARTRVDILEAAARAFARTGYHSATMRDIAREAGYTAASLYTYFKGKQEMLEGLFALVTEDFLRVFDEPVPGGMTFQQRLELLLQRILTQAERRRYLFAVFLSLGPAAARTKGKKVCHDPIKTMEEPIQRMCRWFDENATAGDIGHHSPEDTARFLASLTQGFLQEWLIQGVPEGDFLKRGPLILDLFLNGVGGKQRPERVRGERP